MKRRHGLRDVGHASSSFLSLPPSLTDDGRGPPPTPLGPRRSPAAALLRVRPLLLCCRRCPLPGVARWSCRWQRRHSAKLCRMLTGFRIILAA